MSFEGQETTFDYVTEPDINLICSICHYAFIDPVTTTTCQHTFCKDCILKVIDGQPQCPIDRSALSRAQLRGAGSALSGILDDLKVRCGIPGCELEYERGLHVAHRAACDQIEVACPNDQCEEKMKRSRLAHHLAVACPKRTMNCEVCKETITASNIWQHRHPSSHLESVSKCRFCKQDIERNEVAAHRWRCDKVVVSCPHARHGCATVTTRGELGAHVKTCPFEQLATLMSGVNRRMTQMEERIRCFEQPHSFQSDIRRDVSSLRTALNEHADMIDQMDAMVRPMWRVMGVPAINNENLRRAVSEGGVVRPEDITISAPGRHAESFASPSERATIPHMVASVVTATRQSERAPRMPVERMTPRRVFLSRLTPSSLGLGPSPLRSAENTRSRSYSELHARPDLTRDDHLPGRIPSMPSWFGSVPAAPLQQLHDDFLVMQDARQVIRMAPPRSSHPLIQQAEGPPQSLLATPTRPMTDVNGHLGESEGVVFDSPDPGPDQTPGSLNGVPSVERSPVSLTPNDESGVDPANAAPPSLEASDVEEDGDESSDEEEQSPQAPQTPHEAASTLLNPIPLTHSNLWRSQRLDTEHQQGSHQPHRGRDMGNHFPLNHPSQPSSFAGLAFARLGYPSVPAQPSGPQDIDDQLGELRGTIHRLAEGMDTMERQNQARNVTENLRVQEEVSSLRAIVQVMRNQVMMGTQAHARAAIPQSPTSSSAATDFTTPSSVPIRESIAFSTQHADIDGPSETSSISSLITAVNPIRRPRGSVWGRGLGQPMGIPPELDDGAPTVRVEVNTSGPRTEGAPHGSPARSRGQRGQSVLDRLHLRGSRSSRNVAER